MISLSKKSDALGAMASSLCLVHCLVTPIIFIVQTCTATCCSSSAIPDWWILLDYLFLGVSFLAIVWSSKTTSKEWMKYILWVSWFLLLFVILNERLELIAINQYLGYVPALTLVFLHVYNRKYCQCKADDCCANNT
ncbi:MAG: MerC domain-containing protein [Crocinitomicaceae bacterium]